MTSLQPDPPAGVVRVARKLEEAGHSTWAVGGAVRDTLLGLRGADWDLATHATPKQVRRIFRRTVPIGIEHGTVGVLDSDGTMYEVTTFRLDVETDGRHAVVRFAESVDEDLARRDFTINAIAWHPLRGEYHDPFGGRADLEARVLRTVGVPTERFAEDYLRILRAMRFAGRFDLKIHPDTWAAARAGAPRLRELSAERIREELLKILRTDRVPSRGLDLYRESGALAVLYPELQEAMEGEGRWPLVCATVDSLPTGRPFLRLAGLLRDVPAAECVALLTRLRLSNAQLDETAHLATATPIPSADSPDPVVRRWLSKAGPGRLTPLARLDLARARAQGADGQAHSVVAAWRRARVVRRSGAPLSVGELAFTGRDLIRMGFKPGPHFGRVLDELLAQVLDDPDRNRPEVLEAAARELMEAEGV